MKEEEEKVEEIEEDFERCPDCGSMLVPEGRCRYCPSCGWSACCN